MLNIQYHKMYYLCFFALGLFFKGNAQYLISNCTINDHLENCSTKFYIKFGNESITCTNECLSQLCSLIQNYQEEKVCLSSSSKCPNKNIHTEIIDPKSTTIHHENMDLEYKQASWFETIQFWILCIVFIVVESYSLWMIYLCCFNRAYFNEILGDDDDF